MFSPASGASSGGQSITDLIGRTPLVRLPSPNPKVVILGKSEGTNPGGSVKDRPAWSMIRRAEERKEITPEVPIIEPTSGNTGIALAMVAAARGLKLELVMPADSTKERVATMRAFGATVVLTPPAKGMEGAIDFAHARQQARGYRMLDQFSNPDNPRAHYETTGPEIWEATGGRITHFVSAMGTTGTIMGVSRFLKETSPEIEIVGCQPTDGSRIPGIRRWPKAYLPRIFEPERVDRIIDVDQSIAERMARALPAASGVFCGASAAGAVWAAQQVAAGLKEGVIVCVLCDRGDRYLSSPLFADGHPELGALEVIE
ncbi:MAG: cysteine synthase CysM [Deltaproteobacteria bacterium]|nr:cysteine synthase CysM [Deltaproteobacteria bacterium]